MNTITNFKNLNLQTQRIAFKSINIKDENIVKEQYGQEYLDKLLEAKRDYSKYHWELNVDQNGYSLTSPTVYKTYCGPFSLKKRTKKNKDQINYQLIIRMDDKNRVKYPIDFATREETSLMYRLIKKSDGLQRMLLILKNLEKQYVKKHVKKVI